jgi:hypothetical protein
MSFWTYQTSQERCASLSTLFRFPPLFSLTLYDLCHFSAFQNMVLKNAEDRLMALERQLGNGAFDKLWDSSGIV